MSQPDTLPHGEEGGEGARLEPRPPVWSCPPPNAGRRPQRDTGRSERGNGRRLVADRLICIDAIAAPAHGGLRPEMRRIRLVHGQPCGTGRICNHLGTSTLTRNRDSFLPSMRRRWVPRICRTRRTISTALLPWLRPIGRSAAIGRRRRDGKFFTPWAATSPRWRDGCGWL